MAGKLTFDEASKLLNSRLVGASFDRLSYFITGWELRFQGWEAGEFYLRAGELESPDKDELKAAISSVTHDLLDTNEPEDVVTATQLFSVLNKWRIDQILLNSSGMISITFENSVKINVLSQTELTLEDWSLNSESELMVCDSGDIFLSKIAEHE